MPTDRYILMKQHPAAIDRVELKLRFGPYNFYVRHFRLTAYPAGSCTDILQHDGFQYHFVVQGSGHLRLPGKSCPIVSGLTFITRPQQPFAIAVADSPIAEPLEMLLLHLNYVQITDVPEGILEQEPWGDYYEGLDARHCVTFLQHATEPLPVRDKYNAASFFIAAYNEWHQQEIALYTSLKTSILQIIIRTFRNFARQAPQLSLPVEALREHRCNLARNYIHSHYASSISPTDVAAFLHISCRQLQRMWREHTGSTLTSYIEAYRLEQVCGHLLRTTRTIEQLALDHGFSSSAYLHYVFKRRLGMTPARYREQHQYQYE